MAGRIFLEIAIFLLPFGLFGIYLLVTADAERDGRRKWPINVLFLCGLGLAVLGMFVLVWLDRLGAEGKCWTKTQLIDGVLVEGQPFDCENDLSQLGKPLSDDPGGSVNRRDDMNDASEPGDGQNGDPQ
ncbi:MAG: DUF6111 family protein [Hyphomonas sp.]